MSTDIHPDPIAQAHRMTGVPLTVPWRSFREFAASRFEDPQVAGRLYLSYHDDDGGQHRRYTYREFGDLVARLAIVLTEGLGLRRGERLATLLFNHDMTVAVYVAAWSAGLTVVPINIEEASDKKRYILEHSEAVSVWCWHTHVAEVEAMRQGLPIRTLVAVGEPEQQGSGQLPDRWRRLNDELARVRSSHGTRANGDQGTDPGTLQNEAVIVYTSGTTGAPKGVVLTAENLVVDADGIAGWHAFGAQDCLGCILPIHHVNGMVVTLMTPLYCCGSTVVNRRFRSGVFWRRLQDEQISCVSVVPTILEFLLDADEDISRYRLERFRGVICGAGPLLKETAVRFEDRFGFPIRHGYGLSESTCYSCFLPNDLSYAEHRRWLTSYDFPSIGVPIRHNEMAILDGHGIPVGQGVRGEICIRGQTICAGYFKRPDANQAAFQWGWFRSGDEGFFVEDERGRAFFFISGRIKELIIRGGVNISPLEIDDVLKGHPEVKFAMAVPFEHRYYGEEIAAYIVPRNVTEPPSERDLAAFCRTRLPFAKQPKVFMFGAEIPYTTTGKPKRLELKSRLATSLAVYRDRQFKDR